MMQLNLAKLSHTTTQTSLTCGVIDDHNKSIKAKREAEEKLASGKVAPEIIGKDVDGKEMKLSDYRGKIVVLDFWGDW